MFNSKKNLNISLILLIIIISISFIFIISCGNGDEQEDTGENGEKSDTQKKEKDYPDEAVVYVYSSFTDTLKDTISSHINEEYGVKVNFEVFEDTGPMVASIIREKDNPKADLVIGIDNSFGLEILNEDVIEPYVPENLNLEFDKLNFDKSKRLVPYDYGYVAINYDSERLEDIPDSFLDLTSDKYKENIAVMNPQTSSPGRIFLLETIARFGQRDYLDFWREFKPSITNITSGWSDAYYGLYIQGESDMVISYTTSPPAHIIYEDTDQYKTIIFDNKAYIQIETCGVIKNADNRYIAKRIIDYIISKEFQEMIPKNQFMFPVNPDAELPPEFVKYAKKPEEALLLDTELVRDNIGHWLTDWENIILE